MASGLPRRPPITESKRGVARPQPNFPSPVQSESPHWAQIWTKDHNHRVYRRLYQQILEKWTYLCLTRKCSVLDWCMTLQPPRLFKIWNSWPANESNGSVEGDKNSIHGFHIQSSSSVPAPARATSETLITTDDAVAERNSPVGPCTRHT